MAVAWKKLAYEEDVVLKTTLATAHSVMVANEANTPIELAVVASRIVGRASTGNIAALQKSDVLTLLNVEDGADVTDATNVASAGAVMESDFTAKGDIIIGTGVGTAAVLGAETNGQILTLDSEESTGVKWAAAAGTGDLKADGSVAMTADFDFAGYAAKDVKIHTVANNTALLELTPVVGKLAFQSDTLAAYICTSAA